MINTLVFHTLALRYSQSVLVMAGAECVLQGIPHPPSQQAAHQSEAGSPGC